MSDDKKGALIAFVVIPVGIGLAYQMAEIGGGVAGLATLAAGAFLVWSIAESMGSRPSPPDDNDWTSRGRP